MLRLYVPVYALTLLLSAFLLFAVQPMFGKMILPLLGGTPAVWNTAMLFFQCLLLAGYAYAHATAKFLPVRAQAILHLVLLAIFSGALPIAIPAGWAPSESADPALWQLGLMAAAVGGPFFVLSGSAPLLQHWFSHTGHRDAGNPYFLYAASNLGSMSALLAYPFIIEPSLDLPGQSALWAAGYAVLAGFIFVSGLLAGRRKNSPHMALRPANDDHAINNKTRLLWLLLSFIPSSLMLGVTTFITTDLATVPLPWIVPLALYVGTFIIVFARKPLLGRIGATKIQGILLIFLLAILVSYSGVDKAVLIVLHLLLFFFTALACHHELAALRPPVRHLTQFYLVMSLGGALGGVFNALLAPRLFVMPVEYALVLALACLMRNASVPAQPLKKTDLVFIAIVGTLALTGLNFYNTMAVSFAVAIIAALMLPALLNKRWVLGICALIILAFNPPGYVWGSIAFKDVTYRDRNFFGVVRVAETDKGIRLLLHGTTIHGEQAIAPEHRMIPLAYYSTEGGFGDAMKLADAQMPGAQRIAGLGMGVGAAVCHTRPGRSFDYFEIDPAVIKVAENPDYFTFLRDCGTPYKIIRGDARLTIRDREDKSYDIVFLDAFSSDNIPVHLVTAEAFELYRDKLKDGGFIVMNISNRYLDLGPVIAAAGEKLGMAALRKESKGGILPGSGLPYQPSDYMVLTPVPAHVGFLKERGWKVTGPDDKIPLWTDRFSNIVSVLKILQ